MNNNSNICLQGEKVYLQNDYGRDACIQTNNQSYLKRINLSLYGSLLIFPLYLDNTNSIISQGNDFCSNSVQWEVSVFKSFYNTLDRIIQKYEIVNHSNVSQFIIKNESIASLLLDCHRSINLYFESTKLQLELINDEENLSWKTLFVRIHSDKDFDLQINMLNDFLINWMAKQPPIFRKLVTVSII